MCIQAIGAVYVRRDIPFHFPPPAPFHGSPAAAVDASMCPSDAAIPSSPASSPLLRHRRCAPRPPPCLLLRQVSPSPAIFLRRHAFFSEEIAPPPPPVMCRLVLCGRRLSSARSDAGLRGGALHTQRIGCAGAVDLLKPLEVNLIAKM